jgi:hypothetical protein
MARAEGESTAESPPRHFGGQRSFGLGPNVGFGTGAGATIGTVFDPVGLWLSGGYIPVFVFGNKHDVDKTLTFDAYSSAQIDADVSMMPWHAGKRIDFGLLLGYRYNTLLGHGVSAGPGLQLDLSSALGLFFSITYSVFPAAQDRLAPRAGYPTDRDASIPWLQGGGNLGLIFYP